MTTIPRPRRSAPRGRRPRLSRAEISALVADLIPAAEPNRLHLLLTLAEGERNVGALVDTFGYTGFSAISRHLTVLRFGGLVEDRRQGRRVVYALTDAGRALVAMARPLINGRP